MFMVVHSLVQIFTIWIDLSFRKIITMATSSFYSTSALLEMTITTIVSINGKTSICVPYSLSFPDLMHASASYDGDERTYHIHSQQARMVEILL